MTLRVILTLALCAVFGAGLARTADEGKSKPAKKPDDSYVKVEAKGQLFMGVKGPDGELLGTLLNTAVGAYELDIDAKLKPEASKLNGKSVIVTGAIVVKPGSKRGSQTVIKITTVKEAK